MKRLTAYGQYRACREISTSDADAALQRFVLTYEFLLSARATSSSARRRSSAPSLVKAIFLAPRSMSFAPGSYSSMDSWRDKVGCVICSTFAARVMLSSRTTVRKQRRTRSSIRFLPPLVILSAMIAGARSFVNIGMKRAAFGGGWRGVCCTPINRRAGRVATASLLRPYGKAMIPAGCHRADARRHFGRSGAAWP